MAQEHRELADVGTFGKYLGAYREQLEDPGFASGLLDEGRATGDMASRLARLHSLAAGRFEERATRLTAEAERVDAYERGAYSEPLVSSVMLTVLVTTTLGFSIVVLLRIRVVGVIPLVVTLGMDMVFVRMWRRTPYKYEADYGRRWDDAANLARDRAQQARNASHAVDAYIENPQSTESDKRA